MIMSDNINKPFDCRM